MDEYPEIKQENFDRSVLRQDLQLVEKKQRITIMLDTGVIGYFKSKAGKRGYQTLINEALKTLISSDIAGNDNLEKMLRKIIREELSFGSSAH